MTRLATEHAELFLDASLALFFSQFAILSEMGRGIGGGRLQSAGGAGRTLVPVVGALALVVLLLGLALGVRGAGRALGVECRRRRRVLGLARDLRLAFPVPGINGLRESVEAIKGAGLSDVGDLILDAVRENTVEDVAECAIAIAADLSGEAIELYNVFIDFLSFFHGQVVQLVFCISNRVMRAEIALQFGDKLMVTVHSDGMGVGVGGIE